MKPTLELVSDRSAEVRAGTLAPAQPTGNAAERPAAHRTHQLNSHGPELRVVSRHVSDERDSGSQPTDQLGFRSVPRRGRGWLHMAARDWVEPQRGTLRGRAEEFRDDERGAVTAEYAVVIMAAVAFAGLLVAIMKSREVRELLVQLVQNALGTGG